MRQIIVLMSMIVLTMAASASDTYLELGNYTICLDYRIPDPIYFNWTNSNASGSEVKWDWGNVRSGEWTSITIIEPSDPLPSEVIQLIGGSYIPVSLWAAIDVGVEINLNDTLSNNDTGWENVDKPYPGLIALGHLDKSGSTLSAYATRLNNKTMVTILSTENEYFTTILRDMKVIPKEETSRKKAKDIAEKLNL
jgi:hypothetical protein